MTFCTIRLGKESIKEIELIDSKAGLLSPELIIDIKCKQVPYEVSTDAYCFIFLGSDNNKGTPTKWDQGLRAFGKVVKKSGGPSYKDEWKIEIKIVFVFTRSLKQQDFIEEIGEEYLKISGIPIIGLNTYSNQTIQLINQEKNNQNVDRLFDFLNIILGNSLSPIVYYYPDLRSLISLTANKNRDVDFNHDRIEDEIEPEESHSASGLMENPFDPTQINIDTKTPSLDTLIKRIATNAIQLNSESYFQRKPNLWDEVKQSRLIESILIRFPLPAFYFDGSNKNNWLVVDGLQRLSTIKNFIVDKTLKLTNLEFLTQLNGKTWNDLELDLQRVIEESQVVIYIINPGTPSDVKFNIFKRINTGGLILVPQEIRHALFQGSPANFIAQLADIPEFIAAMGGKINTSRMLDRDFANRFLAFYYLGYESYTPDLDTFMSRAMASIYDMSEIQKEHIKQAFQFSMSLNKQIFGKHAFRKFEKLEDTKKPLNKALFDVFSVNFAKILPKDANKLISNKSNFISAFTNLLTIDDEFFWSITSSTSDKNRVSYRFSAIQSLINSIINP